MPRPDATGSHAGCGQRTPPRRPQHCVLAAAVAAAAVLCLFWPYIAAPRAAMVNRGVQDFYRVKPKGAGQEHPGCPRGPARTRAAVSGGPVGSPREAGNRWRRLTPGSLGVVAVPQLEPGGGPPVPGPPATRPPGIGMPPPPGCPPAGGRFRAVYMLMSLWRPGSRMRHDMRTAISMNWGRALSRASGCAFKIAEYMPRLSAAFFNALGPGERLTIPGRGFWAGVPPGQLRGEPRGIRLLPACVSERADDAGAPERWCDASHGNGQFGVGDRASLPGRSTRYRIIWLVCPRCGARMECLFYDEGDAPVCANSSHGRMEVEL
jgi:hypothetical protein